MLMFARLPVNTTSLTVSFLSANTLSMPIVWNTMFKSPSAMSSFSVPLVILPKLDAVMCEGSAPTSLVHISDIIKSTLLKSPFLARRSIAEWSFSWNTWKDNPASVPPPTPLPPICTQPSFPARTNAVPVPRLTTSASSLPLSARPPLPMATNSSMRSVCMPYISPFTSAAPTPVITQQATSFSDIARVLKKLPIAPYREVSLSDASTLSVPICWPDS